MACDDTAWIQARITKTETLIVAYENAIEAIAAGAQMYQLDTGQSRMMVTRAQLGQLRTMLDHLEARHARLCARLNGGAATYVKPGF